MPQQWSVFPSSMQAWFAATPHESGFPVPSRPHPPDRRVLCPPTLPWSEVRESHGMEKDSSPVPCGLSCSREGGWAHGCVDVAFIGCVV